MAKIAILSSDQHSLLNFRGKFLKRLVLDGHEVHAISPWRSTHITFELEKLGVFFHPVYLDRAGSNPLNDIFYLVRLYKTLSHLSPEVVVCYTIKPVIFGLMVSRFLGVRRRYALITGLGFVFTGTSNLKQLIFKPLVTNLYKISLIGVSHVFFQNLEDKEFFEKNILKGISTKTTRLMGSGVDLKKFKPTPKQRKNFSFVMVARALHDKGVIEFLDASKKLKKLYPEIRFMYVGSKDSNPSSLARESFEELTSGEVIEFFGWVDDVRPIIAGSSVFVLPSYREGLPRSTLEAMAMGRPIITTDVPGCRDTVRNGENGILIPAKDSDALFDAMLFCWKNKSLLNKWGKRSREIVENYFDVEQINSELIGAMKL